MQAKNCEHFLLKSSKIGDIDFTAKISLIFSNLFDFFSSRTSLENHLAGVQLHQPAYAHAIFAMAHTYSLVACFKFSGISLFLLCVFFSFNPFRISFHFSVAFLLFWFLNVLLISFYSFLISRGRAGGALSVEYICMWYKNTQRNVFK